MMSPKVWLCLSTGLYFAFFLSVPETPEIGSTPMGFCIAAASAGDATNSSSTHTVFARIFNSPPRIKSEPGEIATGNEFFHRPLPVVTFYIFQKIVKDLDLGKISSTRYKIIIKN